jgi:predicted phage terminase large subunit-like protein
MVAKLSQAHKLDAQLIEGFQKVYLWEGFDDPAPTPPFHRTMWSEAANEKLPYCGWAAPRNHAKTSAVTFVFALAAIVFRFRDHILIASDSEGQATTQVKEIKNEILENEQLCADFGIAGLLKDTETEIIIQFTDGYLVRVIAKGSEQRLRGMIWRKKRPNLLLGDDLEFDEIVMNPERLKKFKSWFFKQLVPMCAKNCLVRIVGTILSFDSLLADLMEDDQWTTHLWAAHESFDDFSNILWPEHWPEARLRALRQMMINQGQADSYSQEMLNRPLAQGNAFFEEADMMAIPDEEIRDWELSNAPPRQLVFYASIDLAVSTRQSADLAVIAVATVDAANHLDIVDVRKGRYGAEVFVEELFRVAEEYEIETFLVEAGAIQKSLMPFINQEMGRRGRFLNFHLMTPSKDKQTRAQSIRARMRAHHVRFDKGADWYDYARMEMLQFPRGKHDDFVDTMSQFGQALDTLIVPPTEDELEDEQWAREAANDLQGGRNRVTGY